MRTCRARQWASLRFPGHPSQRYASNVPSSPPEGLTREPQRNLLVGKHTRVIYQGFTGRVATQNARESIDYGTNIVGGVKPGKDGEHLGLPVLPSVRAAKEQLKPDATAIFVPMTGAAAAIEEAIEAEIPLIVAVAEHIPVHDMLRIKQMLRVSQSWLVGANSPGIIAPLHSCRIGFQPLPIYAPGHVGVIAKSGTLSYEAVASLTRAGLGQSLCVGCGGDPVSGTTLESAFEVLINDPDTHAIVVIGETGGTSETNLADRIKQYQALVKNPKPIVALVAGRTAPGGRVMGHAGAFQGPNEPSTEDKYQALRSSGVTMVDHPERFGPVMRKLLPVSGSAFSQKRSMHTLRRRGDLPLAYDRRQRIRRLHLHGTKAVTPLAAAFPDFQVTDSVIPSSTSIPVFGIIRRQTGDIRVGIDIPEDSSLKSGEDQQAQRISLDYPFGDRDASLKRFQEHVASLDTSSFKAFLPYLEPLARALIDFIRTNEVLSAQLSLSLDDQGRPTLSNAKLHFDDAAYKSAGRQEATFALRDKPSEDAIEVAAEAHGIVYVTLHPSDPSAAIGTLVNGAGLAMNTVDALALAPHEAKCTNFLDTGGKATSDTVKTSFELILRDARVKVVFVNIFGGLTDCGMIADGVIMAFREVDMRGVPVVVRLRGTNEEVGQRKIADSGLRLEAFDGFEEAARRVVELARA